MTEETESTQRLTILQIFNRYQFPGGEEASVLRVADTLGERHRVIRCYYESRSWAGASGGAATVRQALSMLYNPTVVREIRDKIRTEKPDLILLHNIFPVCSAGLLWYLSVLDIPVVQYIHNFRPFSVNGYCWAGGKLATAGLHLNFLPEIRAGAWQDSKAKTAWYALNLWLLHLTGTYKRISGWFAISQFMADTFRQAGIDPRRIKTLRHSWNALPAPPEKSAADGSPPYLLFLGRLTDEKGLKPMVEAWKIASKEIVGAELVVAGDGPLKDWLEETAKDYPSLRAVGHVGGEEKSRLLANATAIVVPSIWWEPLGLVVYEGYDNRRPVLAASSGGLTETVVDRETGLLHEPGDAEQLASHMVEILRDPGWADQLGANGRELLHTLSDPEAWKEQINHELARIVAKAEGEKPPVRHASEPLVISVYLADQNPGHDRSFGISRMSQVVLDELKSRVRIDATVSRTSQGAPDGVRSVRTLPWGTRRKTVRLFTDHTHPLFTNRGEVPNAYYFPKGYLPFFHRFCKPSVVTIHDTIIQYDADHYPHWRKGWEYTYWERMLKHTLTHADRIMTVSDTSKRQIEAYMDRHQIPRKPVLVTYEPCAYEALPQPETVDKDSYVVHLASVEPHKRTAHLIRWWHEAEKAGRALPSLHLIGSVPKEVSGLLKSSRSIVRRPFLEDSALQDAYRKARALILPSEIEGFGLPALEAYYLGTPVCFVKDTSVEEVLSIATDTGGFRLDDASSLFSALDDVMAMSPDEVRACGLKLRETYAASKVAERMLEVFRDVAR